jgi:CelD/BcsL family acetyltransferase involved in cellulose biosynthesis
MKTLEELKQVSAGSEQLILQSATATIFSSFEWLSGWWRAYARGSDQLLILAWSDLSGLVAVAPLYLSAENGPARLRTLRFVGDASGDSDGLDVPIRAGLESSVAEGFLDFLKSHKAEWDVCRLLTVPVNSPFKSALTDAIRRSRWPIYLSRHFGSVAPLGDTWELYLSSISSKEKGKIKYYGRRLDAKYRVRYYKCATPEELDKNLGMMFSLHAKRWAARGERGSFAEEARRAFYREVGRAFLSRGWLEFWILELDGEPRAAQFGFRLKDSLYALQEGFDPEYNSDSIGFLLRAYALEQLIQAGVRKYDFLGGESAAKQRWCSTRT